MPAACLGIKILTLLNMPVIQLKIFLSHLQFNALLSYLKQEGIYVPKKYVSKKSLVDMIVIGGLMKTEYTEVDNDLPPEMRYELIHEKLNNVISAQSNNES